MPLRRSPFTSRPSECLPRFLRLHFILSLFSLDLFRVDLLAFVSLCLLTLLPSGLLIELLRL